MASRVMGARACSTCGKPSGILKLMDCGSCRAVRYCDKTCRRADWKSHKQRCIDKRMARIKVFENEKPDKDLEDMSISLEGVKINDETSYGAKEERGPKANKAPGTTGEIMEKTTKWFKHYRRLFTMLELDLVIGEGSDINTHSIAVEIRYNPNGENIQSLFSIENLSVFHPPREISAELFAAAKALEDKGPRDDDGQEEQSVWVAVPVIARIKLGKFGLQDAGVASMISFHKADAMAFIRDTKRQKLSYWFRLAKNITGNAMHWSDGIGEYVNPNNKLVENLPAENCSVENIQLSLCQFLGLEEIDFSVQGFQTCVSIFVDFPVIMKLLREKANPGTGILYRGRHGLLMNEVFVRADLWLKLQRGLITVIIDNLFRNHKLENKEHFLTLGIRYVHNAANDAGRFRVIQGRIIDSREEFIKIADDTELGGRTLVKDAEELLKENTRKHFPSNHEIFHRCEVLFRAHLAEHGLPDCLIAHGEAWHPESKALLPRYTPQEDAIGFAIDLTRRCLMLGKDGPEPSPDLAKESAVEAGT